MEFDRCDCLIKCEIHKSSEDGREVSFAESRRILWNVAGGIGCPDEVVEVVAAWQQQQLVVDGAHSDEGDGLLRLNCKHQGIVTGEHGRVDHGKTKSCSVAPRHCDAHCEVQDHCVGSAALIAVRNYHVAAAR